MGQSTDGLLAYGFDLGIEDEKPEFLGEHEDLGEYLAAKAGEPDASWKRCEEFESACPIELVGHCSGDYTMYILAVRGTVSRASRGSPQKVDPVPPDAAKIAAAKTWCEARDIEWQEPAWLLASMWN